MDSWKEFDQNPITHSAAHHLVAIAELVDEYGYARVSDVARHLEITRGSVSVTLKGLKQRGLVTEDERRHLGLSPEGERIARGVMAKKEVMKRLFIKVLGVEDEQADVDTCKIEHLISDETARQASRLMRFLSSSEVGGEQLLQTYADFEAECSHDPSNCPVCSDRCMEELLAERRRKGEPS